MTSTCLCHQYTQIRLVAGQSTTSNTSNTSTYYLCLVKINVMLLHFKSTEVFEIWILVLCPRGVSPSLITILPSDGQCSRPSTWWLTKWLLRNALLWLWVTLLRSFWHRKLAGCSLLSGTRRVVSSILTILAPSHDISYCYDIPRYIVTLAILVSSRKYRR